MERTSFCSEDKFTFSPQPALCTGHCTSTQGRCAAAASLWAALCGSQRAGVSALGSGSSVLAALSLMPPGTKALQGYKAEMGLSGRTPKASYCI